MTFTHFTSTFHIYSTLRPTTTLPCIVLLLSVLTRQVLDLVTLTYISCCSDFDSFYIDVRYLLNYKAYNHQTLHSASPQCTDSAGTLIQWPWPLFHAPLTLTHFMSTFDFSSTIRPTTTKPCIVLLLDVLTWQIPWHGNLDTFYVNIRYLHNYITYNHQTLHSSSPWCTELAGTLTYISRSSDFDTFYVNIQYLLSYKVYNHHTLHSVLLDVLTWHISWPSDLDLYFKLQWLLHILHGRSVIIELYNTKSQCSLLCWRYSH